MRVGNNNFPTPFSILVNISRFCVYQIGISEAGCVTKIQAYEEV